MIEVYNQHRGSNIVLPLMRDIDEVRNFAECCARLGYDAFYRAFEVVPDGYRYVTSFSVLAGVVREHKDVTIPAEHW